jgi:hypothetical protein
MQTELLHKAIHVARDASVKILSERDNLSDLFDKLPRQAVHDELLKMMNLMVKAFEASVPEGTKIWVALRSRTSESELRTILRAGHFSEGRGKSSVPLKINSTFVEGIIKSYAKDSKGSVIISSSDSPEWTQTPNDMYCEDRSVIVAPIFSKRWNGKAFSNSSLVWMLIVNSDQKNTFSRGHLSLMRAFADIFSLILAALTRIDSEQGISSKGKGGDP